MTIDFPCLQKDISFWFPTNTNEVTKSLENLEVNDVIVNQPKANKWLLNEASCNRNGDVKDCNNINIMSPVLKDTPTSAWLADKAESNIAEEKKIREADLTTSIWLASSSSEPFTCVTKATAEAATIEWPQILFQNSPGTWLANQRVERSDIDQWLAKRNEGSKATEDHANESILDNWIKVQSANSKVWMVQEDPNVTSIHDNWIECANHPAKVAKMEPSSSSESSSWFQSLESSTTSLERSKSIEKWLCLAADDDDMMENEETIVNDDESSIAVLSYGEQVDNENDFDMIEEESEKQTKSFWLFN